MQAVITDDKKSSTLIDVNEMYNIIKKAIENEKPLYYHRSFSCFSREKAIENEKLMYYHGLLVSENDLYKYIKKIKLNENEFYFPYLTLKDDEVIKKIEETISSSKQSKENLFYNIWSISDQEKNDAFIDLSLVLSLVFEEMKLYVYFQILIENDLYIIDYSTFKELYKMMNEKSINYIFTKKVKIKSCNPPLNFNSENVLDTSFWLPFEILVENKENNKTLSYILTGYTFIKCSNNEVIEEKKRGMFFTDIQKLFL